MNNEMAVSTLDETIDSIIKSKLTNNVNLNKCYVKLNDSNSFINNSKTLKAINTDKSEQINKSSTLSNVRDLSHPIKCYVNQDNTISLINNTNSSPNEKGDIYYACLTSASNVTQQDQILQLIPQNQLANYIVSNKDYSTVQFMNAPKKSSGNQFIDNDLFDDQIKSSMITKQTCAICNVEFPSKRAYLKHMTIHDNDREFKCRWCKVSYNHDVNLLVHVAIIHPNQCTIDNEEDVNFRCLVCSLKFSRKKAFQGHCLIHQIDEELYCDICSTSFNSRVLLDCHNNDYHNITKKPGKGPLHCRICKHECDSVGHMKRHYKQFHQKTRSWPDDLSDEKLTTVKNEIEGDQNFDPSTKQRRSSQIAAETIKLYAKGQEARHAATDDIGENRRRGRPRKVVVVPDRDKSEESVGEVRKRGRPRKVPGASNDSLISTCSYCSRTFKTGILLRRHEVTHTGLKEFECPICRKRFTQKSSVKIHMAVHDETKSFQCDLCDKTFTYEHNMHTHIRIVHKVNPAILKMKLDSGDASKPRWTGPKFMTSTPKHATVPKVADERVVPVAKKPSRCRLCKAAKRRSCDLCRYVLRSSIKLRPLKCQLCYRSFQLESVLANHRKSHWRWAEHWCERCSKSFNLASTLAVHQRLDEGRPMKYRCQRCQKKFTSASSYQDHVTTDHPSLNNNVIYLDASTGMAVALNDDIKVLATSDDEGTGPHAPMKTYILQERLTVAAVRPFKCNQCNKSYKLRRYLRDHLKDHKSYNNRKNCPHCDKTFLTIRSLQQHTRTQHLKRRIFACPICPATFILKASLIRHGLVHSTVKPYACPMCLRQFKAKIYCDRHINLHKCPNMPKNIANLESETGMGPDGQLVSYCPYRLVDAEHGVTQGSMMPDFVGEEYTDDKYMVVNLDKDQGGSHLDQGLYYSNENHPGYYYPTAAFDPSLRKVSLADKYPLLKATLFSNDDDDDGGGGGTGGDGDVSIPAVIFCADRPSPQILASTDMDGGQSSLVSERLYHGCATCLSQFSDSLSLISHVKESHTVAKDFQCFVCNKAFSVELSLWAHAKIHEESIADYPCRACDQRFQSVPSLSRHVRMQHNDTLNYYRCTHCNQTYKTTRELDSHIKQINADYDALIMTADGSGPATNGTDHNSTRRTEAYRRLPRSIKNPNRSRDMLLGLADDEIDQIASLDVSTTTKLSMQELIKAARQKRGLQKSSRQRHSEQAELDPSLIYPYNCAVCHKGFNRASNLHQHLSVHTKQTPYECTKCNRKFRHRCSLKTHENTKHSGLMKLLRCHLCLKLLRSQVAMRNHMKIHLKTYPSECGLCQHQVLDYDDEKRHRRLKHSVVTETDDNAPDTVSMTPMTVGCADRGRPNVPGPTRRSRVIPRPSSSPPKPQSPVSSGAATTPTVITCVTCGVGFSSLADYGNHSCNKPKWKSHQCILCDENFVTSAELCLHICEVHQRQTKYNCSLCNLLFVHETLLISHRKSVHNI